MGELLPVHLHLPGTGCQNVGGHGANMVPADCTAYLQKLGNELVRPLVNSTVATLNAPLSPGVLLLGQLQMHITTTFGINPL